MCFYVFSVRSLQGFGLGYKFTFDLDFILVFKWSKQANIRPCQVAHTSLRHCQFGCLMRPVPLDDSHISKDSELIHWVRQRWVMCGKFEDHVYFGIAGRHKSHHWAKHHIHKFNGYLSKFNFAKMKVLFNGWNCTVLLWSQNQRN